MKVKKKEKYIADDKFSEYEKHQSDHELFLNAFEKPTQIYRYLKTRSPVFLHRNLSYMRGRTLRNHGKRSSCFIDKFKDSLACLQIHQSRKRFDSLCLEINGVFASGNDYYDTADLEVFLVHSSRRRRKPFNRNEDVQERPVETKVCSVSVPLNPAVGAKSSAHVLIEDTEMNFQNGSRCRGYSILFRARCAQPTEPKTGQQRTDTPLPDGLLNGRASTESASSSSNEEIGDEPAMKKRKKSRSTSVKTEAAADESDVKPRLAFDGELTVYDERRRRLLRDGEYELVLYDARIEKSDIKEEWSIIKEENYCLETFNLHPVIKFSVKWISNVTTDNSKPTANPVKQETVDDIDTHEVTSQNDCQLTDWKNLSVSSVKEAASQCTVNMPSDISHINSSNMTSAAAFSQAASNSDPSKPAAEVTSAQQRVFYHFMYKNKTRQQTEARADLTCPWCLLNCVTLYPLLKHLRNCHARFNFTYHEHPRGARIDVSVNESYDGSYVGNPLDLQSHIGYCFGRYGPVRRMPVSQLLVYKPGRPSFSLDEFMEPETELVIPRSKLEGHNRLYNHTITLQPIRPSEIDVDSEDELDPDWLRQKTANLIDDFTDVNSGEKEIMKMWNIHIMNHNYIGDCLVPKACADFVQEYGPEIIQRNLCRNVSVHLSNLCDFGLIKADVLSRTMMQLLRLRARMFADGLLVSPTPVHVSSKWDPLRNSSAVPIVTADSAAFPKLESVSPMPMSSVNANGVLAVGGATAAEPIAIVT